MDDNNIPLDLKAFEELVHHLGESDLLVLNHLIADRIKVVRAEKKVQSMAAFEIGDAVFFNDKQGVRVDATVLRLNKKTLSLLTDEGHRWNVAPELCQLDSPVPNTTDMFEDELTQHAPNVTVLPGTATTKPAAKGRWYGGTVELPAYVTDDEQPYRPTAMIWVDAEGLVAANEICPPGGDLKQVALDTLKKAQHSPMTGKPQRPKYITVNNPELADFLAKQIPDINIEYGDAPILREMVDRFESMMPDGESVSTYLSTGLSPDRISTFFDAAAALYRSAPWKHVPHDACLLSITIKSLGIYNAVLSVIGQMGENHGIIVYPGLKEYCQYHMAIDRMKRDLDFDLPPHTALSFDDGAEVPTEIRKEIAEHGWQVPNTSSYPIVFTPDGDRFQRPLAVADIALFEALSQALPTALKQRSKLIKGWNVEVLYQEEFPVDSLGKKVSVDIIAPYPFQIVYDSKDQSDRTMIDLATLAHLADEPNYDAHGEFCEILQKHFFESPEGKKCADGVSIVKPLLDFAFSYQNATIATLQASSLEEIVFEIIPRKVMVSPDLAREIIEELRLFYRFLKRQYGLPQADHCREVLGGNAVSRLKKALSGDSGFGPGKAALSSGMFEEFDDGSFPSALPGLPGMPFDTSGFPPLGHAPESKPSPSDQREKKKKRKATKKARKKNR